MFYKYLICLLVFQLCHLFIEIEGVTDCQSAEHNCSQCISVSKDCFWCEDQQFEKRPRCNTLNNMKGKCSNIEGSTQASSLEIITNRQFSSKSEETVQLKPQKVKIELRSGSHIKVDISYKRAEDYPIDLYYLMDLSCTMLKQKKILEEVGQKLADKLRSVTSNFRIGFGSFVDKPIMPFSAFKPEKLKCNEEDIDPAYSFSHQQSLTSNSVDFVKRVKEAGISGNVDNPEGTLDALMQVLTCTQQIGWRNQSNKIIVVATDAEFHYAGDGRLAGIVTPNDGECHMKDNAYTHYNLTDYPSMHQIAEKAQGFNIVFTVAKNVESVYRTLANIIRGTSKVALLQENNEEATNLIETTYDSIRSSVELRLKSKELDFIDIEFYSKCQTEGQPIKTSKCDYTKIQEIMFEVHIKLNQCPKDPRFHRTTISIGLPNNKNEVLEIDLELLCGCNCDQRVERNSYQCSNNGTLACGVCRECNGRRIGPKCECDPEKPVDLKDPEKHCKDPKQNGTNICSGRAKCECNKCDCKGTGYQGDYCEIDESGCYPQSDRNNQICNGNGVCNKGQDSQRAICECHNGYTGTQCECSKSTKNCVRDDQECSGQGKCVCGKCICNETTTRGEFCQLCPSCEKKKYCNQTLECVPQICETFYGSKDNCTQECDFQYILVDSYEELDNTSSKNAYKTQCVFQTLDNECGVEFSYERTDQTNTGNKLFRISKATKNCKAKLNLVVVSGSVIAGTLLVGLALLLIWKLLTEIWDRKEYARFQKELSKVNWEQSENPLYKEAKSTFTNPMFALRDRATKRLSRLTERFSRRFDVNH